MHDFGKIGAVLSAMVVFSMAVPAFADEAPFATYNIRVENNPVQSETSPVMTSPISKGNVAFRIQNNTGQAAYFMNGAEKTYIPVISETTVTVPFSTQQYQVVDESGKTLASWRLASEQVGKASVSSASSSQFTEWGQQIQQVITSAQNRSFAYEPKPEPMSSRSSERNKMIRGFW